MKPSLVVYSLLIIIVEYGIIKDNTTDDKVYSPLYCAAWSIK